MGTEVAVMRRFRAPSLRPWPRGLSLSARLQLRCCSRWEFRRSQLRHTKQSVWQPRITPRSDVSKLTLARRTPDGKILHRYTR